MPTRRQMLLGIPAIAGCASVSDLGAPTAPSSRTQPRDAMEVAHHILAERLQDAPGRVWALFHVDAARGRRVANACRAVYGVGFLLDAAGIDADDLDRVLTLSSDTVSWHSTLEAVHVYEHRLAPERAAAAFESAVAASPGAQIIEGLGFPAADITVGTAPRLLAAPEPQLLVTLPAEEVVGAIQFVGSGGLPTRTRGRALVAGCTKPSYEVLGIDAPATVSSANAEVSLDGAGNAHVRFAAVSSNPHQAVLDAQWITERVREALTIDIKIAKLRVFGPYTFRARGSLVVSDLLVSRDEAEWIVGMARAQMPGG